MLWCYDEGHQQRAKLLLYQDFLLILFIKGYNLWHEFWMKDYFRLNSPLPLLAILMNMRFCQEKGKKSFVKHKIS